MQGNLNEIDICSILQLIELGQRTGQLWVEAHTSHQSHKLSRQETAKNRQIRENTRQSWFVFFLNGQIVYCQTGDSSLSRLDDYLRHYRVEQRPEFKQLASLTVTNSPEYAYIWVLLEQNIITPKIARTIIYGLVQETLFDLLSLHQGSFIFNLGTALVPQLTTLEIAPLVAKITKQVQEWKQLYPHIQSTEQLPVLADMAKLSVSLSEDTVKKLHKWADGKSSLRQLARYLNRDISTLAKTIYPYVQEGWLQLVYSDTYKFGKEKQNLEAKKYKGRIVCIEDTLVICETIESILKLQGYEAISITNPLQALSFVFQLQPDLILCDIAMPELDGYEICAMLRHSTVFRVIPIIMLTGKDGFIDRVRARMVGATDYLTKPFTDQELLMLVEQYLNLDYCTGV
ncbi:response regulator [Dolichospermum sp. ST_con]|nr:response regulator [Dolichospermum sp. ST_con]MDD1420430.1 response regulator [Dolichospermum sp. ST_sed1]MDD1424112.1 response regulator [Dolichospermum sp. ST_sed9]MDD1433134.1 response regulator [Dolichospermum sp. ST_sed6]MDD1436435.1 response regulator [Dolichospermum sp. ST_sed10]MDD1442888.1 response regulator [Dolichospermum sp. ST_sed3]MDD1447428.1 response regulator [Dolichospermum sp. ST_sed8]MDD1457601.1 response regulator [Dolichospermum sp. ST_sed7]MDD1463460.1 response reg